MAYPFVQARWYTRGAMAEARAILWHMAEGYGTVGLFVRTDRNVSSHYVIDRYGVITQMVRLTDASHSAHWSHDANDADASSCSGLYGPEVARAVLGAGWADLNRYVVAVEVEGYRSRGPNIAQKVSIVELAYYLIDRLPSIRGNLGHRDVQDYKSCPGCRFPFDSIGGHGLFTDTEVDDMDQLTSTGGAARSLPVGTVTYNKPDGTAVGSIRSASVVYRLVARYRDTDWYLLDGGGVGIMAWVKLTA